MNYEYNKMKTDFLNQFTEAYCSKTGFFDRHETTCFILASNKYYDLKKALQEARNKNNRYLAYKHLARISEKKPRVVLKLVLDLNLAVDCSYLNVRLTYCEVKNLGLTELEEHALSYLLEKKP